MTAQDKTRQLDIDRIDVIILDLTEARLSIMRDRRREARGIIETAIKDLQTQAWMLNTVP